MSRRAGSLRLRLLGATLVTLSLALIGAHAGLSALLREHVLRQFDLGLTQQLDQLTARLEFDAQGMPLIGPRGMSDPRWEQPFSGLYWQVERLSDPAEPMRSVLRSRSLWDSELALPADALADGVIHRHALRGARGEPLRAVERSLQAAVPGAPGARWRLAVAGDLRDTTAALERFDGLLAGGLAALGVLLVAAAVAQVALGLAPLRDMQQALQRVREGREQRLGGRFPAEVQPLVDEFNGVLDRNAEVVASARAHAGNLAHALKTPLAVLSQAARELGGSPVSQLIAEQVRLAERHVHGHLARARAAAGQRRPGQRTALEPAVHGLLRAMERVHAERRLDLGADALAPGLAFSGEEQDLQEMLGNLVDNACNAARSAVSVSASREGPWLCIAVDDDGPGIEPAQRAAVLQRGVRLDETRAGSGLGLAITVDLARLYGGDLALEASPAGGLRARLRLPAAA